MTSVSATLPEPEKWIDQLAEGCEGKTKDTHKLTDDDQHGSEDKDHSPEVKHRWKVQQLRKTVGRLAKLQGVVNKLSSPLWRGESAMQMMADLISIVYINTALSREQITNSLSQFSLFAVSSLSQAASSISKACHALESILLGVV